MLLGVLTSKVRDIYLLREMSHVDLNFDIAMREGFLCTLGGQMSRARSRSNSLP